MDIIVIFLSTEGSFQLEVDLLGTMRVSSGRRGLCGCPCGGGLSGGGGTGGGAPVVWLVVGSVLGQ